MSRRGALQRDVVAGCPQPLSEEAAVADWHQVFVNEGTFGLLVDGMIAVETADWSNGLVAPMYQGALITTGINTGYVEANVTARGSAPAAETWEEIVEVSVRTR